MRMMAPRVGLALVWGSCMAVAVAAPGHTAPVRYRCAFDQRGGATDPLRLDFTLDPTSGRAFAVGNVGMGEVAVHAGHEAITFIDRVPTGVAQTTTVADSGQAVHSRHTLLPDGFAPSQMLGACVRD
jgi:hypothetical protein